jgi:hypothetical protein
VTVRATQTEHGWRSRYAGKAGKGGGHAGSQAARHMERGTRLAGKQTNKSGSRSRQERVGEQNGQQAVRQGSREADKLARNGRHEHRIQYMCKAGRAGEARRQARQVGGLSGRRL